MTAQELADLVTCCQTSPNRTPTRCDVCGATLAAVIADGLDGEYVLLECPDCHETRALTQREMVGFRVFGELLLKLQGRA